MTSRKLAKIAISKGTTQKITELSPFGETVLDRINRINKIFIFLVILIILYILSKKRKFLYDSS